MIIKQLLEEKGYNDNTQTDGITIKKHIRMVLNKSKKGVEISGTDMNVIYAELNKIDHEDAVNIDQILTRMRNEEEKEYQWGSVVLNRKWKLLY